ncbi:MAG: hypothetical protein IZT59_03630 [Verrucomicrobia bacterium]|nr:hypothetical protein [Verrucomicrobiota bacterium]
MPGAYVTPLKNSNQQTPHSTTQVFPPITDHSAQANSPIHNPSFASLRDLRDLRASAPLR